MIDERQRAVKPSGANGHENQILLREVLETMTVILYYTSDEAVEVGLHLVAEGVKIRQEGRELDTLEALKAVIGVGPVSIELGANDLCYFAGKALCEQVSDFLVGGDSFTDDTPVTVPLGLIRDLYAGTQKAHATQ